MIALAFDQAPNNTGYAWGSDDLAARVSFGTIIMSDYGSNDQRMMADFRLDLLRMFDEIKPDAIFFEQIVIAMNHVNLPVTYRQFNVAACLQYVAMERGIVAQMVEISPWRKWFTGKGNANKEASIKECLKRNLYVKNDHEAEAVGILDYGLASISREYRQRRRAEVTRRQIAQRREAMEK